MYILGASNFDNPGKRVRDEGSNGQKATQTGLKIWANVLRAYRRNAKYFDTKFKRLRIFFVNLSLWSILNMITCGVEVCF